jgi:hypothetical protein
VDPPPVLRPSSLILVSALSLVACGGARQAPAPPTPAHAGGLTAAQSVVALDEPAEPYPGHWYFEWLSQDGQRALLRRLDGDAAATLQTRVVDVGTGKTVADETFPELGKLPSATIGRRPNEVAELMGRLAAPAFAEDLVRGATIAEEFPFGSCGRLSASTRGGAVAFNAGDWLYVASSTGHVQKRLTTQAAYDPRFTPDGKSLLFRRATGMVDKVRARYELFVVPTDLHAAPTLLPGTAGARDRITIDPERGLAMIVASQEPHIKTCALSIGLRAPFAVKKLACPVGGDHHAEEGERRARRPRVAAARRLPRHRQGRARSARRARPHRARHQRQRAARPERRARGRPRRRRREDAPYARASRGARSSWVLPRADGARRGPGRERGGRRPRAAVGAVPNHAVLREGDRARAATGA